MSEYRVWWIPQVPGKPFYVPVSTAEEGWRICRILAEYDDFQFKNKIKPDYSNAGGVQVYEVGEGANAEWTDIDEPDPVQDPLDEARRQEGPAQP